MNARHTPGPWAWDESGHTLAPVNKLPDVSAVHTILSPNGCFGYLGSDLQATLAEDEANKRLIAATTDLLDACEYFESVFGPGIDSTKDDRGIYGCGFGELDAIVKVREAIAKATGSAP